MNNGEALRRWATVGLVVTGAALLLVVVASHDDRNSASTGSKLPASELATLDGARIDLADYRGRPLVLNFFASWCAPCLAEMPAFEQVHQDVGDKVAFLGVNLQDGVEDARAIVERTGITYTTARDPDGTLFADLGGTAMPTTVLVDADGNVVEVHSGELSGDDLGTKIDNLLLA